MTPPGAETRDHPPQWESDAIETVARLRETIRERDAEIARLEEVAADAYERHYQEVSRLRAELDARHLTLAERATRLAIAWRNVGWSEDMFSEFKSEIERALAMERAKQAWRNARLLGVDFDASTFARALQQYGDERAREARAAAIEEAAARVEAARFNETPIMIAKVLRALTEKPGSET